MSRGKNDDVYRNGVSHYRITVLHGLGAERICARGFLASESASLDRAPFLADNQGALYNRLSNIEIIHRAIDRRQELHLLLLLLLHLLLLPSLPLLLFLLNSVLLNLVVSLSHFLKP